MSGLFRNRVWFGSAALVAVFAVVACGDDDDGSNGDSMAGKGGGGGSKAGSPSAGNAGKPQTAGSNMGGKAGMASTDGGMAGDDMGVAGDANQAGAGGATGGDGAGGEGGGPETLADKVRRLMDGTSPLPALPADTTNAYADNAAAATLGQKLFFDEKFSGAMTIDTDLGVKDSVQKVSCASCHSGQAMDDERSNPATVSIGTGIHTRNAPAVVNSAFYTWVNWAGRFGSLWELPTAVVENGKIMNSSRLAVMHRLYDAYKTEYEAVFGAFPAGIEALPAAGKPKAAAADPDGVWEGLTADQKTMVNRVLVNYGKGLHAYMRKLVSRTSPFDTFMAGADNGMSESAQRGAVLFNDFGCTKCHQGSHFTDNAFHDLGIPQTNMDNIPATDDGRWKDADSFFKAGISIATDWSDDKAAGIARLPTNPSPEAWRGAFRTPSLRNVSLTAPYMHSGQFASLSAVIDFYSGGGNADTAAGELQSFIISASEKADLIEFLTALKADPVDAALVVDNAPN